MDTSLEHFAHVEDVARFIQSHLPEQHNGEEWKNVCTDVMNCELAKVEPLLEQELEKVKGNLSEEDTIRELLRAASWYTHPQLKTEELVQKLDTLSDLSEDAKIHIKDALEQKHSGQAVLPAVRAIEPVMTAAPEIRDQLYYQLLYPHWFEIVKQWAASRAA